MYSKTNFKKKERSVYIYVLLILKQVYELFDILVICNQRSIINKYNQMKIKGSVEFLSNFICISKIYFI